MSSTQSSKFILLVDDDPVASKLTESRLTANGYHVMTCNEAAVGLERAIKHKPDLIVLDVMMPIVNGFNFCRLLKSHHEHKGIPIILLTSRSTEEDRRIGQEVGANAYLTKPVNIELLVETIKELVGERV